MDDAVTPPRKSVGTLFPAAKTKPRSPDMTGKFKLQVNLLQEMSERAQIDGTGYVICNIASWAYVGENGRYMTVELSPCYPPKKRTDPVPHRRTLDHFFVGNGDDSE